MVHSVKPAADEILVLHQKFIQTPNKDWTTTKQLRDDVQRDFNATGALSMPVFENLLKWKLRGQQQRTEWCREIITPEIVQVVTGAFWKIHAMGEVALKIQFEVLCALPGVGTGVATAILALTDPKNHGVIDVRNWVVLYGLETNGYRKGKEKDTFSFANYETYLKDLRSLADATGLPVQEIDYLLWRKGEK